MPTLSQAIPRPTRRRETIARRKSRNADLVVLGGAVALRFLGGPFADLAFLVVAAYAISSIPCAIKGTVVTWFFIMFNPGIAEGGSLSAELRYLVFLSLGLSVCFRVTWTKVSFAPSRPLGAMLLLGLFLLLHSLLFSTFPLVSLLKAASWTWVLGALLIGWSSLDLRQSDILESEIYRMLVLIILLGLPLLLSPLGYFRNGSGFQGLLNQPQVFGVFTALVGAWTIARLFQESNPSLRNLIFGGLCFVLVFLSQTRTGGVSLVFGLGLGVLFAPLIVRNPRKVALPGLRSPVLWTFLLLGALFGIALSSVLANLVMQFLTKFGRAYEVSGLVDAYMQSRGSLIELMWLNIQADWLIGLGFGIASIPSEMVIQTDPMLGLPVQAAVEKGTMPLAILEEVGIFGFLLTVGFLAVLVRAAGRNGVVAVSVLLTALLVNFGESIFFSPGGMGMLLLVLVAWAARQRVNGKIRS